MVAPLVAAALIGGISSLGSSAMSTFGGGKGGKSANMLSDMLGIKPAEWYEDPAYKEIRDKLTGTYADILDQGKVPEAYQGIFQPGGKEFEAMLGKTTSDISASVGENMARQGLGRSGIGQTANAQAVGNAATQLRYSDFERVIGAKQALFGVGLSGTESMLGVADEYAAAKRNWEQQKQNFQLQKYAAALGVSVPMESANNASLGSAISSGISAASLFGSLLNKGGMTGGGGIGGVSGSLGLTSTGGFSSWAGVGSNFGQNAINTNLVRNSYGIKPLSLN